MQLLRRLRDYVQERTGIHVYRGPNPYHIVTDYPVSEQPRYGYKIPPHPLILEQIEAKRQQYAEFLEGIVQLEAITRSIPCSEPSDPTLPYWNNGWLPPRDGVAILHFLLSRKPKRYLEIGSGNSTKFARLAVNHGGLKTKIISIDPQPRAEIDMLCDSVIRTGLQDADLAVFDQLEPGDILSFDGSHRVFADSDVTVFFLDVLPRVPAGTIVQIHDIFWPKDYPPTWGRRFYSEQYLLGQLLVLAPERIDVMLANAFVDQDPDLRLTADKALTIQTERLDRFGEGVWPSSFWFKLRTALVAQR